MPGADASFQSQLRRVPPPPLQAKPYCTALHEPCIAICVHTPEEFINILADLLANSLETLTEYELQKMLDQIEEKYRFVPSGSIGLLVQSYRRIPISHRLAQDFCEIRYVAAWVERNGISG
jgi:hypothetical protein